MSSLTLTLLGGVDIRLNDVPIVIQRNALLALLVYLACSEGPHDRGTLAGLLWPDQAESEARNSLRQTLHHARALPATLLAGTRQTIAWADGLTVTCDVRTVNALLDAEQLIEAVAVYKGPLLGDRILWDSPLFNDWLIIQRERLHRRIMSSYAQLVAAAESRRDWPQAEQLATAQLALDNWREATHRSLIRALAAQGRRAAAIAQYAHLRRVLADALGVEPSGATQSLYESVVAGTLGELTAPLHNLPEPAATFVGRAAERLAIGERLAQPACRWLTLIGPGGVGKSRLGLEAARDQIGRFPGGVWHVDLHAVTTIDALALAIADTLGLALLGNQSPARQLNEILRTRAVLLLLDNVEQLREPGIANWAATLLAASTGSKLLMTSRERLDNPAEWLMPIGGLAADDAIELFVRRARHIQAGFARDPANERALTALAAAVDGMPLALELAAGWLRIMPVGEIVHELTRDPDLLRSEKKTQSTRHVSIRAIFESAWQRLPPGEQQFLRRLAVFQGGCSRQAAEHVGRGNLFLLLQLVNRSLLSVDVDHRYRRHPLILQFMREKLAAAPADQTAARHAHAQYFADLLAAAYPDLRNENQLATVRRLRPDEANMRAAFNWAIDHAAFDMLDRLTDSLLRYDQARGNVRAIVERHRAAIAFADAQALPAAAHNLLLIRLLKFYAFYAAHLGQYSEAQAAGERAVALVAPLAHPQELARCLQVLGVIADYRGDQERSIDYMQRAVAVVQEHEVSLSLRQMLLNNLAQVYLAHGRYAEAEPIQREALRCAEAVGDPHNRAVSLAVLGTILGALGKRSEALERLAQARSLYEALEDQLGLAHVDRTEGEVLDDLGRYAEAIDLKRAAADLCREIGFTSGLSYTLYSLGQSYRLAGDPAAARRAFEEAYATAEAADEQAWAAAAAGGLAQLLAAHNAPLAAHLLASVLALPAIVGSFVTGFQAALAALVAPDEAIRLQQAPPYTTFRAIYQVARTALDQITLA